MNIPAKAWNEMKGKMEDTSLPEWQQYYADLKKHDDHYLAIKPKQEDYRSDHEYQTAISQWSMSWSCGAPNKPGYYRANND
jgi:hypothetical protein